jgi:hypothetical protein
MTFFRRVQSGSYRVSRLAGDLNALQTGGVPKYTKRVVRRKATRKAFGLFRNGR